MALQTWLTVIPQWMARNLLGIPEEIAWRHSITVMEVRVTRVNDGWRVMVKGNGPNGPVVAFILAASYPDAIEILGYEVESGTLSFKPDKYPIKPRHSG